MSRFSIVTDEEWRDRLTEEDYQRRQQNLGRRMAELRNQLLAKLEAGSNIRAALREMGLNYEWLKAACEEANFRAKVVALIPFDGTSEPATSFGRWVMACDRVRGCVGFSGDLHLGDAIAVAKRARSSEWLQDRKTTTPLDVVILGGGGKLQQAVERLAADGIILGIGAGPAAFKGFAVEVIPVPDDRFFRMVRQ